MSEKINIAELLKNCPKGMELDCTMCDDIYLDEVTPQMIKCFIKNNVYNTIYFHHDGTYLTAQNAKCVIFPKGKTTWEGFQIPFKDGDILATDLGSVFYLNTLFNTDECYGCYVGIGGDGSFHICAPFAYKECCGFATEEEKQKLFKAIKDNGYKWNTETKTLEKLIEPKFKVGDRIRFKTSIKKGKAVTEVKDTHYILDDELALPFTSQDNYELAPDKFDISTLKPFDKVLVRHNVYGKWGIDFFGYYNKGNHRTTGSCIYKQCVPYEGNEHLLSTTNDCNEYFKTWE